MPFLTPCVLLGCFVLVTIFFVDFWLIGLLCYIFARACTGVYSCRCYPAEHTNTLMYSGCKWSKFTSLLGERFRSRGELHTVKSLVIWTVVHQKLHATRWGEENSFTEGEAETCKTQPQLQDIFKIYWQYMDDINVGTCRVKPNTQSYIMNLTSCS